MTTDDTINTGGAGTDLADLKKSGVEILDIENTANETQSEALIQTAEEDAEKLEHEFEIELGSKSEIAQGADAGLATSLQHLQDVEKKLKEKEKILGEETQRDIEALKKTKAMIEEKIGKLKDLEQKEKLIEAEIKEVKDLDARVHKVAEDVKQFEKDVV